MKKISISNLSVLTLFITILFGSCGLTKHRDNAFGGVSFTSNQTNTSNFQKIDIDIISQRFLETTGNKSILTKKTFSENSISNISEEIQHQVQNSKNQPNKISTSKIQYQKPDFIKFKSTSLFTLKKKISNSKWPNSKSSIWKWMLTILGLLSGVFGFMSIFQGIIIGNSYYSFGTFFALVGSAALFVGYLFIIWARNIQ